MASHSFLLRISISVCGIFDRTWTTYGLLRCTHLSHDCFFVHFFISFFVCVFKYSLYCESVFLRPLRLTFFSLAASAIEVAPVAFLRGIYVSLFPDSDLLFILGVLIVLPNHRVFATQNIRLRFSSEAHVLYGVAPSSFLPANAMNGAHRCGQLIGVFFHLGPETAALVDRLILFYSVKPKPNSFADACLS